MEKLAGSLGLCRRAGKLWIGAEISADAVKRGKTKLVILASDASENPEKKIAAVAAHHGARVEKGVLDRAALGHAVGKGGAVAAVAVGDECYDLVAKSLRA